MKIDPPFELDPNVKVRTRFAPSPTGYLHVGGARTALYSWLFAKHNNGEFVLRIEDTDLERSTPEATAAIIEGMEWLNLAWEHGPYYQTKQKPRYDRHCLHDHNHAADEPHVVRFKNPTEGSVVFDDAVRGRIEISNSELDDLIIRRTDGSPTYNFCVVVDDWDMGITHVVRGEDHINNTPRQINILKALGAPIPVYAHVSMINGDDGQKLSKRHGAVSVMQYRDVSKSASAFNTEKLLWLNHHYIRELSPEYVAKHLAWHYKDQGIDTSNGPALTEIVTMLAERCKTLKEMASASRYFFEEFESFDEAAVKKHFKAAAIEPLEKVKEKLTALSSWDLHSTHEAIEQTAAELEVGMGKVGMPLRVAVTGSGQSPSMDVTLVGIGRERVLARIQRAIDFIKSQNA